MEDAKIDDRGRQVLVETNNYQTARKECIEWAAWDDIQVEVLGAHGQVKFTCAGAYEAETRYPKTVDAMSQLAV
jgi:hypothetical protein